MAVQFNASPSTGYRVTLVCSDRNILVQGYLPEEFGFDVSASYDAPFAQGLNDYIPLAGKIAKFFGVNLTTQAMTAQVWQGNSEISFNLPLVFQAESNSSLEVIKPINDLLRLTMPIESQAGGLLTAPGPHVNVQKLTAALGSTIASAVPIPQQGGQTQASTNNSLGTNPLSTLATNVTNGLGAITDKINTSIGQVQKTVSSIGDAVSSGNILNGLTTFVANGAAGLQSTANGALSPISRALLNSIENNISLYIGNFLYFPSVIVTDVGQTYNTIIGPDDNPMRAQVNLTIKTFYIPTQNDLNVMFPAANKATPSNDNSLANGWAPGTFGGTN